MSKKQQKTKQINCPNCDGTGIDETGNTCKDCNGSGVVTAFIDEN